jgi:anaerobic selenocysteine-containing dehydrogenase
MSIRVSTPTGSVVLATQVTDDVRPGVVCVPHGWGHVDQDVWGPVAREHPGTNINEVVSSDAVDALSGTAILAGIPVDVAPV